MGLMPHNVAVGILIGHQGVLLCHRRADRRWYADRWDLPGGHIDPCETPRQALTRELHEELGIIVSEISEQPVCELRERAQENDGLVLTAWLIRAWAGEPANKAPEEHDDLRWFQAEELQGLSLAHPAHGDVLAKLLGSSSQQALFGPGLP
jgi:8-oxo-dGTP diphosphatase